MEALLDDDRIADQILDTLDANSRQRTSVRLSEWSTLREAIAQLIDAVHGVSANIIAAAGVKPPDIKPTVRPITAVDRAKARRRRQEHEALVARVLPGRA